MAMTSRKEPAAPPARDRQRPRPTAAGAGPQNEGGRTGRLRKNINDISAELRKVTWPTREETRNLTIVVIGISAVIGALLAVVDIILTQLYTLLEGLIR